MKNVVITGTSSGFGLAMAERLTQSGYTVVGSSRNPTGQESVRTFALDVQDDESVADFVRRVVEDVGSIDVLVNNAGYGISGPVEDTPLDEAKHQFETNYFGVVRLTKAVLPHMRASGGGLIINISSLAGLIGMPFQAHYSASKFALEGLTEALRLELAPFDISVVNVNPGDFRTEFTGNRWVTPSVSEAYMQRFDETLAIYERDERNGADPDQIANLVQTLIERESGYRTRYLVGKRSQTFGVFIKRMFGDRLFERIMVRMYRLS